MIGEVLVTGDKVVITIPQENREWGYNPCPDGTLATFLYPSEMHCGRKDGYRAPGVYENHSWLNLLLSDGKTLTEFAGRVEMVDHPEYEHRMELRHKARKLDPDFSRKEAKRLRDLPDTPFWEGDIVESKRAYHFYGKGPLEICTVRYNYIGEKRVDGSPMPLYDVTPVSNGCGTMSAGDEDLTLIQRGNYWKYYHNEPMVFESLLDEAKFFASIGQSHEIPNPVSGNYDWTKEGALEAIRSGLAHGFAVSSGLFGGGLYHSVVVFEDEKLGKRVAQATLEGFMQPKV